MTIEYHHATTFIKTTPLLQENANPQKNMIIVYGPLKNMRSWTSASEFDKELAQEE
jgi:hypothetical protein